MTIEPIELSPPVNMLFMHIFVVSCRNLYKTGKNCYIKI